MSYRILQSVHGQKLGFDSEGNLLVEGGLVIKYRTDPTVIDGSGGGGDSGPAGAFAYDPENTVGLNYAYKAGITKNILIDGPTDSEIPAGTIGLADDTSGQSVYILDLTVQTDPTGAVPSRAILMAFVDTADGEVTNNSDQRAAYPYAAQAPLEYFSSEFAPEMGSIDGLDITIKAAGSGIRTPNGAVGADGLDGATLTLPDNTAMVYIEVNGAGVISFNTVGYTKGKWPICRAVTSGGEITVVFALNDIGERSFIFVPGVAQQFLATGGAAGNIVCTGIAVGDALESVLRYTTGALVSVLTSEFTISGTNQINNTGGTSTAGSALLVSWKKLTG